MNTQAPMPGHEQPATREQANRMISEHGAAPLSFKMRQLTIRQLDKGFFVEVGCQTIAIEQASQLISLLAQYIANPYEVEQKYMDGKLF